MGSTAEPERFGKVRPLGSKGSNPLQGIPYVYHCLISSSSSFGHVVRSFPPPRSSFVIVVERAGTKDYVSNV